MLYILTPIFCVALCVGAVFSFLKTDNKVYAATGPAPASILDLDGSGKFNSFLKGSQEEYIYFGKNKDAAVKWRVLDTGEGNKYGEGMLLWADKQLTAEKYNPYYTNPDYAFWGTSQMHASLNGGTYYNAVSNASATPTATTTISESASWYGKLFTTDEEKNAVKETGSYTTDNWGLDTSTSVAQYLYLKEDITVTVDSKIGKYNANRISSSHPTSQYASVTATSGVQETTSGDKLFLLDYYDINNVSYGFGDGGLIYANKVDTSWSPASNKYPCY